MAEELANIRLLENINKKLNEIYFQLEIIKCDNELLPTEKLYYIDKYKNKKYILVIPQICLLNTSNILLNQRIKYMNIVISRLQVYGINVTIKVTN